MNTKYQETFVVEGLRDDWFNRCQVAMETAGFRKISGNSGLYQISGHFRRWPKPNGRLEIAILPAGDSQTQFSVTSVCRTDISAATGNPNVLLLRIFKDALGAVEVTGAPNPMRPTVPRPDSIADELAKLAELHKLGILTDEEFAAEKTKLLR